MFLAIDIGGTKTLLALFSSRGFCLKRLKFPTNQNPRTFEKSLVKNLQTFLPKPSCRRRVRAITVAIPGVVKTESNSYSFKFGNLNWSKIDLIPPIKKLFDCQIFFANDANLATLYEASRPQLKEAKSIYLTFSTGIGGGIAKHGKLLKSSDLFEPGHVRYIYKNIEAEWEDLASAKAIIETYNVDSVKDLRLDNSTLNDLISRLSLGLIDILKHESPDNIIIGGPLAFIFHRIKRPLLDSLHQKIQSKDFQLKKAHRPVDSTIYGAYLYAKQNYHQ